MQSLITLSVTKCQQPDGTAMVGNSPADGGGAKLVVGNASTDYDVGSCT